jgi:hypothetical protein
VVARGGAREGGDGTLNLAAAAKTLGLDVPANVLALAGTSRPSALAVVRLMREGSRLVSGTKNSIYKSIS